MKRSRFFIATGYWLAFLLIVLPFLERVVPLLPVQPGALQWRLGAFGALSQSLLLPLVGGTLAIGTAALLQQRRMVRFLACVAFAAASLLVIATALFALDLVQYRASVGAELQQYYQVAGVIYLVSFLLAIVFLAWLGAVSWRAAAHSSRKFLGSPGGDGSLRRGPPPPGHGLAGPVLRGEFPASEDLGS
ncbi:MAG: hypothetical protein FIB01_01870 [Gemmatimonadetes bacterium]|nr:hypothetical protein [Gemmatimonadota bacterium]